MTIQDATKTCLIKPDTFGRPASWKGSAKAIDLGRRLNPEKTQHLQIWRGKALLGVDWNVEPKDLLEDWEVVKIEEMAEEAKQSDQEE